MLRGRFALLASPRCCASPCLLLLTESSGLQTLRNTKTQRSSLLAYFAHALIGGACADTRHMTDATVCLSLEPLRARQTGRVDEGPAFSAPKSSASYASYAFRDAEERGPCQELERTTNGVLFVQISCSEQKAPARNCNVRQMASFLSK